MSTSKANLPQIAVVGHVEWVQFARVPHVPQAGEVVHAHHPFEEPAGGGAVAAVQLARLNGKAMLITALGDDELGRRALARLQALGVEVHAALRPQPTRRAITFVDPAGERTIITLGERLEPSHADASLPWEALSSLHAVYVTAGDESAIRAARAAKVLVASPRARAALQANIALDALVLSDEDALERELAAEAKQQAKLTVYTKGDHGGRYRCLSGQSGTWAAVPTTSVDTYGCGDSFAAGLTYGLGDGFAVPRALALAARCGAVCATGHGPYERQLDGTQSF